MRSEREPVQAVPHVAQDAHRRPLLRYLSGYGQPWYHAADRYGHGRYETWGIGVTRDADVGLTTISDDEIPSLKNQIYVGIQNVRSFTGTRNLWEYPEGAAVQRYGTASGWDQGLILLRNVTRDSCVDG